MKRVNFIICILLYIVSSCSTSTNTIQTKGAYTVCLDSIFVEKEMKFTSMFKQDKSSFFLLDTTSNAMIGEISKMTVCNNHIIISDQWTRNQILIFDKTGHLLYSIGQVGQAPGEYSQITDFTCSASDDLLFILDSRTRKIMVYQLSTGIFAYSIDCMHDCFHIHFFDGKLYTDHPTFFKGQESKHLLVQIDINSGEIIQSYIEPEKYNQGFDSPLSNTGGPFLSSNANQFKYSQIFANTIFTASDEEVLPYLTLESSQWICQKDLEGIDVNNDPKGMFKIIQKDKYYGLSRYIETKKSIFCSIQKGDNFYYLCYEKANGNILFTPLLKEDVFFNDTNFEYLRLRYGGSDDRGAYFYLSPSSARVLSEDIYKDSKFDVIRNLGDNFNGAIFYYEFKE